MKNRYLFRISDWIFHSGSATAGCRMWGGVVSLLPALFPFSVSAQYIKIKLNVPAKIGVYNIAPLELSPRTVLGVPILAGICVLCITGAENMQVLATLTSSDSLRNEKGAALPFNVSLAFRNDGQSQPPGIDVGHKSFFPLSNSNRIIGNMRNLSQLLNAYLFIRGSTNLLPKANTTNVSGVKERQQAAPETIHSGNTPSPEENTTYVGNIYLRIEYN